MTRDRRTASSSGWVCVSTSRLEPQPPYGARRACQKLPDETTTLFGRKVVGEYLRNMDENTDQELSGGQRQRLAVARTFMRSSTMEQEVGLLLFDESSASLDPTAEHGTIDIRIASAFPFGSDCSPF